MKKRFFFVLFTIFISAFLFCKSSPAKKTKPVNSTSTTRKSSSPSNSKKRVQQKTQGNAKSKQNSSNASNAKAKSKNSLWNIKSLDTARNVDYLSDFEKNVILEMNKARTNPKQYADLYIVPRLENFDGYNYIEKRMSAAGPYNWTIRTQEGPAAVKECIKICTNKLHARHLNHLKNLHKLQEIMQKAKWLPTSLGTQELTARHHLKECKTTAYLWQRLKIYFIAWTQQEIRL